MNWQDRANQLTGSADDKFYQLRQEGYDVRRKEVRNLDRTERTECTETISIGADGTTSEKIIKGSPDQMRKSDYLLKQHGFDDGWELVSARSSIWDSQTPDGIEQLYSSKITVKPTTQISPDKMLETFIAQAEKYSPVNARKTQKTGNAILLINISDLHMGQLSWGAESGENYDYKIATQRFKNLIMDIIAKAPALNYEKIVFVKGNDFLNTDNMQGTTTAGTVQTNDVRPQKMFEKGVNLLVWGIDALRTAFESTPIETLLVPGNHDTLTSYFVSMYLSAWFKNDPSVKVDISPKLHKGFAYGNTALLFTHGQHELKNLEWVYTEFRNLIGQTKYTEIHAGHQHRIKVEEKNGAVIRVNPTTAALDNWSYGEGYGSTAQTISRAYSKDGLEYEIYSRA